MPEITGGKHSVAVNVELENVSVVYEAETDIGESEIERPLSVYPRFEKFEQLAPRTLFENPS